MPQQPTARFELILPAQMRQSLKDLSYQTGLCLSELVRRALAEFLERQEQRMVGKGRK